MSFSGLGIGTAIAIYFVIWWVTLFVTLPFRMRSQFETGDIVPGTEPAAPAQPRMARRMAWNTVLAALVFLLYWFVVYVIDFGLDDIPELVPIPKLER